MYLSQFLSIDDTIKFKQLKMSRIKQNRKVHNVYLLCTATNPSFLFEIIEGQALTKQHESCYLLGMSTNKEWVLEQLVELIDQLYNTQTTTLAQLTQ